jgi:hypothetical protein
MLYGLDKNEVCDQQVKEGGKSNGTGENIDPVTDELLVDDSDLSSVLLQSTEKDFDTKLSHLSLSQQNDIKLIINEFPNVFSDKPGLAKVDELEIKLKPNAKIIKCNPYRMSPDSQSKLRVEINSLLAEGLIECTNSEWSSPVIVVPKPDKSIRAVVDFRKANQQFYGNSYPLPRIDDLVHKVGQAKVLSKFDLTKGFYQIPLSKSSRQYTAFCTPYSTYQFTRLPFGLKTSPTHFQSVMNKVLSGLEDYCVVYIDDIVVFSNSWNEHKIHVRNVLKRLAEYCFTVKLAKTLFGLEEIDFVGHTVGNGKMSPREAKIAALLDMPRPTSKTQLHSFVGLANYFSQYIPHFSTLASPLTSMLGKNKVFVWSSDADKSYTEIKRLLSNSPILHVVDYNKDFYLFVDASNVAAGYALCQLDNNNNQFHPICYASKKFNNAQKNYTVTDREALAMVLAVRTFKPYLPNQFTVFSDHEPLRFINSNASKSSRILRWSLELAPYDITVKHIKEKCNCLADFLSRPVN